METALSTFLLSSDPQSLFVARQTCDQYGIRPTICRTSFTAAEVLKQKRFDLFVLDFDLRGSTELLSSQPSSRFSHATDIIALTTSPNTPAAPLRKRVRYLLQKPLTVDLMAGTMKAAYRSILVEKRRVFRCAVRLRGGAAYRDNFIVRPLNNVMVRDLSQTGLCLQTETVVPKAVTALIDFQLPGTQDQIHVTGDVIWSDSKGNVGVQFRAVPPEDFKKLRDWLNTQCPWSPELVAKAPPARPSARPRANGASIALYP